MQSASPSLTSFPSFASTLTSSHEDVSPLRRVECRDGEASFGLLVFEFLVRRSFSVDDSGLDDTSKLRPEDRLSEVAVAAVGACILSGKPSNLLSVSQSLSLCTPIPFSYPVALPTFYNPLVPEMIELKAALGSLRQSMIGLLKPVQ